MDHLHDHYKYRPTVYILAIVDIILSSISLSWSLLFVVVMCVTPDNFASELVSTSQVNRHGNNRLYYGKSGDTTEQHQNMQQLLAVVWTAIVIQILACVLQTVAAIKLLNASKPNANPMEALVQCRFWRRVTAFFTFLMFMKLVFGLEGHSLLVYVFFLTNILLRLACIRYVHLYMRELHIMPAAFGGILPTHHIITQTAVHPQHPYFQDPIQVPPPKPPQMQNLQSSSSMDLPPSYEECVKQPVNKEPDIKQ